MWIKRTPEEILKKKNQRQAAKIREAALYGIVITIISVFLYGGRNPVHNGFVPLDEVASRLPISIIFGVAVALVFYFFSSRSKQTVVCPKCSAIKTKDSSSQCSCGGLFEDIQEMKWHD